MSKPLVVGVMLTADRPEMTARAILSFEMQTYPNKKLAIIDSGKVDYFPIWVGKGPMIHRHVNPGPAIGQLRNIANESAAFMGADIIAHFDSDDWSHPTRLEEQVALLQAVGTDAVGYNDMLYCDHGEAWWYEHGWHQYALGGSLCYWRKAWERVKFQESEQAKDDIGCLKFDGQGKPIMEPLVSGEDSRWLRSGIKCLGVSSCGCAECGAGSGNVLPYCPNCGLRYDPNRSVPVVTKEPRMVCEIHGGNTSSHVLQDNEQWKRVPEWDEYCRERLEHVSLVRDSK